MKVTPIDVDKARRLFYISATSSTGLRRRTKRGKWSKDSVAGSAVSPGDGARRNRGARYSVVHICGKTVKTHRVIYAIYHGVDPGHMIVDHIDGNSANNAPENLRLLTNAENCRNRKAWRRGASRFLGVHVCNHGKPWRAAIWDGPSGTLTIIGTFDCEEEAARAYDRVALERHGQFTSLNFPKDGRQCAVRSEEPEHIHDAMKRGA